MVHTSGELCDVVQQLLHRHLTNRCPCALQVGAIKTHLICPGSPRERLLDPFVVSRSTRRDRLRCRTVRGLIVKHPNVRPRALDYVEQHIFVDDEDVISVKIVLHDPVIQVMRRNEQDVRTRQVLVCHDIDEHPVKRLGRVTSAF